MRNFPRTFAFRPTIALLSRERRAGAAFILTVALLLPGLAAAFAACTLADCPMMAISRAETHDCCPPTVATTTSMDCCESAATTPVAASALPERDASKIVALGHGSTAALAEPLVLASFLPDRRQPPPPLDCLARTCVLRN